MADRIKKLNRVKALLAMAMALILFLTAAGVLVWSYFSNANEKKTPVTLKVNDLFGKLDLSLNPSGKWGSEQNPYLIQNERHLRNLYILQNTKDASIINENTVFQVSDEYGKPCFVGGTAQGGVISLMDIPSVGSEDFPFVSTLRGVTASGQSDYITLDTGEVSDTSVLGSIRITAYEGQIDIGLFGNVGPRTADPGGPVGGISNLLLANIQVSTDATGAGKPEHPLPESPTPNDFYFTGAIPHESNHIGILAGHAQYCRINNISVYYTNDGGGKAAVDAFDISADTVETRYTTAGGIIGFYKDITINTGDEERVVNSDGSPAEGGGYSGLGLGIVYSQDIWEFMETSYFGGVGTAQLDEYGIQDTFGADDKLYNYEQRQYTVTEITNAHIIGTGSAPDYYRINPTLFPASRYRFMVVHEASVSNHLALGRNAAAASAIQVTPSSGTVNVPAALIKDYTFEISTTHSSGSLIIDTNILQRLNYGATPQSLQINTNNIAFGATTNSSGVGFYRETPVVAGASTRFRLRQMTTPNGAVGNNYLSYNSGFTGVNSGTTAYWFRLYAVDLNSAQWTGNIAKDYFQIGVFTFAHSSQVLNKDRISKLWVPNANPYDDGKDNIWTISATGAYTNAAKDMGISSKKYSCTEIKLEHLTGSGAHGISTTGGTFEAYNANIAQRVSADIFPASHYRFMLVAETNSGQYAVTRYGYTVAAQKIDTADFVVPEAELNNYTFEVLTNRTANTNYPPYTSQAGYQYNTPGPLVMGACLQYLCYGKDVPIPNGGGKLSEAVRPLRIYDSVSFMATSVSGSPEGTRFDYQIQAGGRLGFRLQRTTSATATAANYLRFTEGEGFVYGTGANYTASGQASCTLVRLYAVRYNAAAVPTPSYYTSLEVNNTHITGTNAAAVIDPNIFPSNKYRFIIAFEGTTTTAASRTLVRMNGAASTTGTFTSTAGLLRGQLDNDTFGVFSDATCAYPVSFNVGTGSTIMQYLGYGALPVPLRIGAASYINAPDFDVDATAGATVTRVTTTANARTYFRFQRRTGTATNALQNYLQYNSGWTYSANTNSNANYATDLRLYAVCYNPDYDPNIPVQAPDTRTYEKQIYTPASDVKTYDMSQNVLFYTGNAGSSNPAQKFTYDIVNIPALGWLKNDGKVMTDVDTTLKMGDPTSYYYLNSTFWGVTEKIPSPAGVTGGAINVPQASIGFSVQGTGEANTFAKIFVIVATDPAQLVDQTITISYFPIDTSTGMVNGQRTVQSSFALPPIPGADISTTTAIIVRDLTAEISYTPGGSYAEVPVTAYPNLNTLLVAYEFSVPSTATRTYFLEASKGSANFVYLSAERTAAKDNNPTHENDVEFDFLNGIDYVALRGANIATVGSGDYVSSLASLYFGVTSNTGSGADILAVLQAKNFTYNVFRGYDSTADLHTIFISAVLPADSYTPNLTEPVITLTELKAIMADMNFNFTEWVYADTANNRVMYSDVVVIIINNKLVAWEDL